MGSAAKKLVIFGASGGCVDILDTLIDINQALPEPAFECAGFLDDRADLQGQSVLGAPVLGPFAMAADFSDDHYFACGIGSPDNFWRRGAIIEGFGLPPDRFATLIHPTASISRSATIGRGCVIHQNVTVTTEARLGDHVLVLPGTVISHDSRIGDYTIVNAGVVVAGAVRVGQTCYLGANSSFRQDLTIGDGALVGMGSVVVKDVAPNHAVVGSPARFLRPVREEDAGR